MFYIKFAPLFALKQLPLEHSVTHKVTIEGQILKADDEHHVVYGWASVISDGGVDVVDSQGDVIKSAELVFATTEFMKSARDSLEMHKGSPIGQVVHSFPLTSEISKSLGIDTSKEGWIVGVYVSDDKVWKSVKSGDLSCFSIGGEAVRVAN